MTHNPATISAVLTRIERHLRTLTPEQATEALLQPTDAATARAVAGMVRPPTISEALRTLPTSDPYAILGDIVATGGGVVMQSTYDQALCAYCITLPDGRRVVPRCLLRDDGASTELSIDKLYHFAKEQNPETWTPIYFFHWLISPNPRLPLDATPLRYLQHHGFSAPSVREVQSALLNYNEMGG